MGLLAGCGPAPVLEVGPVGYSADEMGALDPSQRQLMVDLTAFGLTVARGRTPDLIGPFIERELRSLMLQRLAMEVAVRADGMDESALRAAYGLNPEPELVVRHLVVLSERWRPEAHRDSARRRAEAARGRAAAGEDFLSLVAEYSDEPEAGPRGGLLAPGRAGSWVHEFWDAARALEEGEISEVVETEYGFHVIRLEERRPVPFEEVRREVLERFVDLPAALSRAEAWADRQAAALRVDTAAVLAWREDRAPATALASWPGDNGNGVLSGELLELYVATLGPEARRQATTADTAPLLALVTGAATSHLLMERARSMGLSPSRSQQAAIERRWEERVAGWAATLGFRPGQPRDAIKQAVLQAVETEQQNVLIARSEIERVGGVLGRLYPARHQQVVEEPSTAIPQQPAGGRYN